MIDNITMNLKRCKETPKGVNKLLSVVDSVVVDATKDLSSDRGSKIEEYSENLYKMVDESLTSAQDLLQTIDETSDVEVINNIVKEVAAKFGIEVISADSVWYFVQDNSLDVDEVMKFISTSNALPLEDKLIIADDILSAYDTEQQD